MLLHVSVQWEKPQLLTPSSDPARCSGGVWALRSSSRAGSQSTTSIPCPAMQPALPRGCCRRINPMQLEPWSPYSAPNPSVSTLFHGKSGLYSTIPAGTKHYRHCTTLWGVGLVKVTVPLLRELSSLTPPDLFMCAIITALNKGLNLQLLDSKVKAQMTDTNLFRV